MNCLFPLTLSSLKFFVTAPLKRGRNRGNLFIFSQVLITAESTYILIFYFPPPAGDYNQGNTTTRGKKTAKATSKYLRACLPTLNCPLLALHLRDSLSGTGSSVFVDLLLIEKKCAKKKKKHNKKPSSYQFRCSFHQSI